MHHFIQTTQTMCRCNKYTWTISSTTFFMYAKTYAHSLNPFSKNVFCFCLKGALGIDFFKHNAFKTCSQPDTNKNMLIALIEFGKLKMRF